MGKLTNITPEEREQAIYTIGKFGEEMTDERIEYYVQLGRNSNEHSSPKKSTEERNDISEENKEFARKVLTYMKRSKSDRQILIYSKKHIETLDYIREHQYDVDYTPFILGEAIRFMEVKKSTTIHHLTGEDLANCINDKKEEFINKKKQMETQKNIQQEELTENGGKTVHLAKIVSIIGGILILGPFFITGFGFNWFWYLVIFGVAFFTLGLFGIEGKEKDDYSYVKKVLLGFLVVGCIMYLWGPLNPRYLSGNYGNVRSTNFSEMKSIIKESGTITEDEAKYLVLNYILSNMKDPNSYESVSWGPLQKTQEIDGEGGGWNIKHRFRGTNSYGGVVTEEHIYIIHKDGWVTTF